MHLSVGEATSLPRGTTKHPCIRCGEFVRGWWMIPFHPTGSKSEVGGRLVASPTGVWKSSGRFIFIPAFAGRFPKAVPPVNTVVLFASFLRFTGHFLFFSRMRPLPYWFLNDFPLIFMYKFRLFSVLFLYRMHTPSFWFCKQSFIFSSIYADYSLFFYKNEILQL